MPRTNAGKTKFVDKKTALNFEVVHRSQRDPLAADEDANQFVLKSVSVGQNKKGRVRFQDQDDSKPEVSEYEMMKRAAMDEFRDEVADYARNDWELGEYNFPKDGYDYAKHMKESGGGYFVAAPEEDKKKDKDGGFELREDMEAADARGNANVPMSLFEPALFQSASEMKVSVGVGRNVPERDAIDLALDPDIDPEILAALDMAEDYDDGQGDVWDDFVVDAQVLDEEFVEESQEKDVAYLDCFGRELYPDWYQGKQDHSQELRQDPENEDDEDDEEEDEEGGGSSEDEYTDEDDIDERRTQYTGFSMTSSRRERGEQGRMLDEQFDNFMDQYEDDEMGELDQDDCFIGNDVEDNEALEQAMDEFIEDFRALVPLEKSVMTQNVDDKLIHQIEASNTKPNTMPDSYIYDKEEEQWDCDTVVSTYSNLENHPRLLDDDIRRVKLSKKSGIALGMLPERRGLASLEEEEEEEEERENLGVKREKGESKDDKKARKQALKEEKARRRKEKKGNTTEYKTELERQKSVQVKDPMYKRSVKHLK